MVTITTPRPRTKICKHHWEVRPPAGATSWGECRKCGRRKRFSNRFDGRDRANNSDLFVDTATAWRPDRRTTYYDPGVAAAYEESQRAGSAS